MKQASPMWITQVLQGHEASEESRDRRLIFPEMWYVGDGRGNVEAGPFADEHAAVAAVYAMGDTSGT